MKKGLTLFILLLLLVLSLVATIQPVWAQDTIYIRADGSVEGTDKIHREGNVYTFTGDIFDTRYIAVERSYIIINGDWHTFHHGRFLLDRVQNVTIVNTFIHNDRTYHNTGIDLQFCSNVTIANNTINGSGGEVLVSSIKIFGGESNTIMGNEISNNERGIIISGAPTTLIYTNNFVNNTLDVSIYPVFWSLGNDEAIFDNGSEGNYWSKYDGIDSDGDGIGDTPHIINENNIDNYPLVEPVVVIPEFPTWIILPVILIVTFFVAAIRKKKVGEEGE